MSIFKRKPKYGQEGDSREKNLTELRETQAQWIAAEILKRENEIRIARIEGMAQVLISRKGTVEGGA